MSSVRATESSVCVFKSGKGRIAVQALDLPVNHLLLVQIVSTAVLCLCKRMLRIGLKRQLLVGVYGEVHARTLAYVRVR